MIKIVERVAIAFLICYDRFAFHKKGLFPYFRHHNHWFERGRPYVLCLWDQCNLYSAGSGISVFPFIQQRTRLCPDVFRHKVPGEERVDSTFRCQTERPPFFGGRFDSQGAGSDLVLALYSFISLGGTGRVRWCFFRGRWLPFQMFLENLADPLSFLFTYLNDRSFVTTDLRPTVRYLQLDRFNVVLRDVPIQILQGDYFLYFEAGRNVLSHDVHDLIDFRQSFDA